MFHGKHLLFLRHCFQFRRQIQRFPGLRKYHGFSPDHLDGFSVQIPRLVFPVAGHLHVPESAVACDVTQIAVFRVGGSEENTLPEMRRHPPPEGSTVLIVLPGYKGFHFIDVRLLHARQLTDLQNPVTLQLFSGGLVIHIGKGQAVGEPFHAQLRDQRALADTLVAVQDNHVVVFDAGIENPVIGRAQRLACHRPDIRIILCAKVVNQEGIHPVHTVPRWQGFKHLPDRMVTAVVRHLRDRDLIVPGGEGTIVAVHVADQLGVILIAPELCRVLPRHRACDFHAVRQLVEDDVPQKRIVFQYQLNVMQGVFQLQGAGLIYQPRFPAVVVRRIFEIRSGFPQPFLSRLQFYLVQRHGEFPHFLKGSFVIKVTEPVNPDDIKCVTELQVSWVLGMVGIDEFVFLDFHTCHGAGFDQVPALVRRCRFIHIAQKGFKRLLNRVVYPVKQADNAVLRQGILDFLPGGHSRLALPGGSRQPCRISPFRVSGQNIVRIQPRAFRFLIHKGSVCGGGRPVHQLVRQIRTLVEIVNAQHLREIPGYSGKLLRGSVPGHRDDDPNPGLFLRAAVGGVQGSRVRHVLFKPVKESNVDAVAVQ